MLTATSQSTLTVHTLRLEPGEELKTQLTTFVKQQNLQAAFVMAAVGSLSVVELRTAGLAHGTRLITDLEVVSLSGTIAKGGAAHLHVVVADASGKTFGGHLIAGVVRTTAEIVLGAPSGLTYERAPDAKTGYHGLVPTAP